MTPDELREFLTKKGVRFQEEPIQHAIQFRCSSGEIFAVYNSGKVVVGGKRSDLSQAVEALEQGAIAEGAVRDVGAAVAAAPAAPSIFIVYGHDETARDALELLLRRMGFEPIILARRPQPVTRSSRS